MNLKNLHQFTLLRINYKRDDRLQLYKQRIVTDVFYITRYATYVLTIHNNGYHLQTFRNCDGRPSKPFFTKNLPALKQVLAKSIY